MNSPNSCKWQSAFSSTETKEKALIRLFNDFALRGEVKMGRIPGGFLYYLAAALNCSKDAINQRLCRLRRQGKIGRLLREGETRFSKKVSTPDKKIKDPRLPQAWLDFIIRGARLLNKADVRQEEVSPIIESDGWIGLTVGGDWHLEHYRTDVEGIVEDLERLGKEPNLYFGFNGDTLDVINLRFMDLENEIIAIPLRKLYEVVKYLFSLVPNTLFVVMGCHDNWLKTRGRYDLLEALQSSIMGYYLGFGGTVNLTVGAAKYRIAAMHKYGGESKLNVFHPCMSYLKNMDMTADIVCIAHRHDTVGVSHCYIQSQPKIFMRSGSQQYKTEYAWKEGFTGAINRYPMVLLCGKAKIMIPVTNFKEGIPILRRLNEDPKFSDEVMKEGLLQVLGGHRP